MEMAITCTEATALGGSAGGAAPAGEAPEIVQHEGQQTELAAMMAEQAIAEEEGIEVCPPTAHEAAQMTIVLPFQVHGSHRLLYCAGFTACELCATMASTKANRRMADACLGKTARTTGSLNRLRRLQSGLHPWPDKAKDQWPNGEGWSRSHPPHPAHRIRIRRSPEAAGEGCTGSTICEGRGPPR